MPPEIEANAPPRPGASPLLPHNDIHIVTPDQARSLLREARLDTNSQLQEAQLGALAQAASLHRAAQVARHEWARSHEVALREASLTRSRQNTERTPDPHSSHHDRVSPRQGGAPSHDVIEGDPRFPSPVDDDLLSSALGRTTLAQQASVRRRTTLSPSPRALRPASHASPRGGSSSAVDVETELATWNRLCRDLAHVSGAAQFSEAHIELEGQFASLVASDGSAESQEDRLRPLLGFGLEPRMMPLPFAGWGQSYTGAAGVWVRKELDMRGEQLHEVFLSLAEAQLLTSPSRSTRTEPRNSDPPTGRFGRYSFMPVATTRTVAFPSLDPDSRAPFASDEGSAAEVEARPLSFLSLPADATLQSALEASRSAVSYSTASESATVSPLPPPGQAFGSEVATSASLQRSDDPQTDGPPSGPASESLQRLRAAEEVTRLARLSRMRQARSQQRPVPGDEAARRSARPAMRLLQRLRDLDGLASSRGATQDEHDREPVDDSYAWIRLPWPPSADTWRRSSVEPSRPPSAGQSAFRDWEAIVDPDGDAIGTEWYRGVRARRRQLRIEEDERRGLEDPDGEQLASATTASEGDTGPPATASTATPPWRNRQRSADTETTLARRLRNRSALVIAEEAADAEQTDGSPPAASSRDLTDGWMLVPSATSNSRARSPTRSNRNPEMSDETPWMRGSALVPPTISASPVSMDPSASSVGREGPQSSGSADSTTTGATSDLRQTRRPRRLASLTSDDVRGLRVDMTAARTRVDVSHSRNLGEPPTATTLPSRHTGASDNVRDLSVDELRQREANTWREESRAIAGNASQVQLDEIRRRAHVLSTLSRNIENELHERQDELRSYRARLQEQVAQRRSRIDELRQRDGRAIGAPSRTTQRAGSSSEGVAEAIAAANDRGHSVHRSLPTPDVAAAAATPSSSLVRRRAMRDPAPSLRVPRTVRMPEWLSPHDSVRNSGRDDQAPVPQLRRLSHRRSSSNVIGERASSGALFDDADVLDKALDTRRPRRAQDDIALASPSMPAAQRSGDPNSSEGLQHCLLRPRDQHEIGVEGVQIIKAIDEAGLGTYVEAMNRGHRRRALTRSPVQPALPASSAEESFSLRFEVAQPTGAPATCEPTNLDSMLRVHNILEDDGNLTFHAKRGTTVMLRFLDARPPSASPQRARTAYPNSRVDEDQIWSRARQRVIQIRTSGTRHGSQRDSRDARRALLGLPPRNAAVRRLGASLRVSSTATGEVGTVPGTEADGTQEAVEPLTNWATGPVLNPRLLDDTSTPHNGARVQSGAAPAGRSGGEAWGGRSAVPSDLHGTLFTALEGDDVGTSKASSLRWALPTDLPLDACVRTDILRIVSEVKARTGGLIPPDARQLMSIMDESTVKQVIASRAEAISSACSRGCTDGSDGYHMDPLGPLFSLQSVTVRINRDKRARPCEHARQDALYGLVFVSDEPMHANDLAAWANKDSAEIKRLASLAGAKGPGLECAQPGPGAGDPSPSHDLPAMSRQEGKQRLRDDTRQEDEANPSSCLPSLCPAALFTVDVSHGPVTRVIDFVGPSKEFLQPGTGPCGRYLAVKLFGASDSATTLDAVQSGGSSSSGGGGGGASSSSSPCYELTHVGAKGWPAVGLSSISAQIRA
ncbi:unnamed protein product [Parajaminaea phylloscopi]